MNILSDTEKLIFSEISIEKSAKYDLKNAAYNGNG